MSRCLRRLRHRELGKVVERDAGDLGKPVADDVLGLGLDGGVLFQHRGLRRREDAIESAQDRQRQDDLAIFVPFVRAAEQIADAPDEVGDLRVGFSGHSVIPCAFRDGICELVSLGDTPQTQ